MCDIVLLDTRYEATLENIIVSDDTLYREWRKFRTLNADEIPDGPGHMIHEARVLLMEKFLGFAEELCPKALANGLAIEGMTVEVW